MIRRLLLSPYVLAAPWLEHPNWMVRRSAQATVLWVASVWLALRRVDVAEGDPPDPSDELVQQLSASTGLRDFLHWTQHRQAFRRPPLPRLAVVAFGRMPRRASARHSDERNFALRLTGPIDQKALRNLLIWQNHVLPSYLRPDDDRQVDVALMLTDRSDNEARLFDLISVVLMLERVRNFVVFWDEETSADVASILMSE